MKRFERASVRLFNGPALLHWAGLFLCSTLTPLYGVEALDISLMEKRDSLRHEIENKIKQDILDPILGPARAFVFADVELEVISRKAEQSKEGTGVISKYKERGGTGGGEAAGMDFLLPGVPKPKSVLGTGPAPRPEAATGSQAQQAKGVQEIRYGLEIEITRCQVTVIHDAHVSSAAVSLARTQVNDFLLPYKIKGKDMPTVLFKPTMFNSYNMIDDLKRPSVYLPLIYAVLFLLLLLFLFGPLWDFFRKYVNALLVKPGAEVNIDQKMEGGGGGSGGGGGKGEVTQEGHQAIDMTFEQRLEESMKQFKPFTYINEENLKRLMYAFLLKKVEPWVIAVVLNYIKPELARQILSMLSVEVQSKVALESLTVRQTTREQIEAIDKDMRESVDFLLGGIEKLIRMLDDAEPAIRKNILEYIKTQKPEIYEKVKKKILMFEDVTGFPDKDMQLIIRNVSNEEVAKAVYKADPQIVNKFFNNMSQGAVTAIKEILEYSSELTLVQVDNAQMKVLDAVKRLEAEGKINVRQQSSQEIDIIDSVELSTDAQRKGKFQDIAGRSEDSASESSAAHPGAGGGAEAANMPEIAAEARQYMGAGVDLYNQGRYEESLRYLEYAAGLDPNDTATQQHLGAAYYALGRIADALKAYELYARLSNDPAVTEWLNNFKAQAGK